MLDWVEISTQENMVMLKECPINVTPWLPVRDRKQLGCKSHSRGLKHITMFTF